MKSSSKINGTIHYLWRAVDQHGNVLDVLVQSRRNALAAIKFFRRLLKGLRYVPAGARHRQARQLRAGPPRGDALGGTSAIEVSEQSGRELASPRPGMRNGSCPRSATSRHISVRVGICCRPPDGGTRWPTASPSGTRSPGLPRPPPEHELGQGFPPEPTHNTRTISPPINLTVPAAVRPTDGCPHACSRAPTNRARARCGPHAAARRGSAPRRGVRSSIRRRRGLHRESFRSWPNACRAQGG